jgi:hypothetical protein
MDFKRFTERGGFKLLAVARLSAPSYALVSYLLNGLIARVEEVVTSAGELALILGVPERQIKAALAELSDSGIVQVIERNGSTRLLRMNLDPAQWRNLAKTPERTKRNGLGDAKNVRTLHPQTPVPAGSSPVELHQLTESPAKGSSKPAGSSKGLSAHEALVFPAGSKSSGKLVSIEGGRLDVRKNNGSNKSTPPSSEVPSSIEHEAMRIFESFAKTRGGDADFDEAKELDYARLLAESHPTEHVLQLITHFGREVPSLALLAGAWMHYSDTFHRHQNEQIDLENYRQRHQSAEKKIRSLANSELKKAQSNKAVLSADEQLLLRIFLRHEQPRKQLYWALKVRERYPHLHDFFAVTSDLALPPHADNGHRKP